MAATMSNFQSHRTWCASSSLYPRSLLRKPRPHEVHILKKHVDYLRDNDEGLFIDDSDEHVVDLFEIDIEEPINLKEFSLRDRDALIQHMQQHPSKWDIRHVFFEAGDSRAPLNCSAAMLKYCFTFHQVDFSFLESLYTFMDADEPMDLCLAHFKSSHTVEVDNGHAIAIPELRRSGRELRMSYLLRSMEYDADSGNTWKWKLRQNALYHSFDAETGQSFWCDIKANDEFKRRIRNSVSALNLGEAGLEQEHRLHRLFAATLSTHLIYLYWCDENWRWYINDMEIEINKILVKARMAPIDDRQSTVPKSIITRLSINTIESGQPPRSTAATLSRSVRQVFREIFSKPENARHDVEMGLMGGPTERKPPNSMITLDSFRVAELQRLHLWSQRIERAVLAVQLNITVLNQISTYYSDMTEPLRLLHGDMGQQYELEIKRFNEEITNIIRGLKIRKSQLQSLAAQLSEGQRLYDGLLQYRNIQISQTFAESAETSATNMESIAYKTAQETASMHIITIVTLIFLPGTFVATFFQSGVFWWKDSPNDMESAWSYRGDVFAFFSSLCFPLMTGTLGIWLCIWFKMRRDRQKEEQKGRLRGTFRLSRPSTRSTF